MNFNIVWKWENEKLEIASRGAKRGEIWDS